MAERELRHCGACAREVAAGAASCPHCGRALGSWFDRWGWWVLGVGIVGAWVVVAVVGSILSGGR